MPVLLQPPIENPIRTTTIRPTKRTDAQDKRLEAVRETLVELPPPDYTIYTDGSATDGRENRRAETVICRGETELRKIRTPAGFWTSSYRAEMMALDSALVSLQEAAADPAPREMWICIDFQSALGCLREGPVAQRDVLVNRAWQRLRKPTGTSNGPPVTTASPTTRWLTRWRARMPTWIKTEPP